MQVDAVASAHGSQRNLFGGEGGWVGREGSDWNSLFFSRFSERFKGIRIFKLFKYINRKFGNPSHEERVSVLAKNKTEGLDLTNHMTGWNCLCKLWDGDENIKTQLQHMGYGPQWSAWFLEERVRYWQRVERENAYVAERVGFCGDTRGINWKPNLIKNLTSKPNL